MQPQSPYQPGPPQPQPAPSGQPPSYDFIMSPGQEQRSPRLPGSNASPLMRAVIFGGGLVVLLILFVIVKGLLSSGPSLEPFVGIVQDQQSLIHVVTAASLQADLSAANKNFAATAQLSLASAKVSLLTYLQDNKTKVSAKQLVLKVSATTDKQLETAQAAGTYDTTFRDIMKTQLTAYSNDLTRAYNGGAGQRGKALLKDDYNQAQLLLNQLNGN